ncbi:hypothetical protein DYB38_005480 [Aphanomyces astaci]|uniref:Neurochondrin n=1 Tax=Aphanomyces astaci TaxID=112090 RepID=A0A397CDH2_APHAT|nr:hypothetical protein DYB38_005480 [Aphanomyces astaci]
MGTAIMEEAGDDPKLAQCLAILAGKSDEHKFAGLLMVTKHLQTEDESALQRIRKAVMDTAGISFFVRLLHTQGGGSGDGDNAAADGDGDISPFQALALNLISRYYVNQPTIDTYLAISHSFCQDISLAREFATTAVVSVVLDVLPTAVSTTNTVVLQDCVQIIHGLLSFDVLTTHSTWKDIVVREIHRCSVSTPVQNTSLTVLLSLLQASPTVSDNELAILCDSFAAISTPSSAKSVLQDFFLGTLGSYDRTLVHSNVMSLARGLFGAWPSHVHDDVARRDSSLQLLALLLSSCGSSAWLFQSDQPWVHIALQLAAIEAKLLLDDAESVLIDHVVTPTPAAADDIVLKRVCRLLPASYGILEAVLGGLMVDANTAALSHTTLLQLKDSLGQVFTVVIEFLTTCRDALASSNLTFPRNDLDPIVVATIRVLGAWMAEETDLLADQLVELVPFLVTFTPTSLPPIPSTDEQPWDSDDEADDLSTAPDPTDVVPFLLPGLLQLTASDAGAAAVATNDAVLQRIMQFTGVVCNQMIAAGNEGVGSLTMCMGIYLNVLLLASPTPASRRLLAKSVPVWQSLAVLTWRHVIALDPDMDDQNDHPSDMYLLLLHIAIVVALVQPSAMTSTTQLAACTKWIQQHAPSMACEDAYDLHMLALRVLK